MDTQLSYHPRLVGILRHQVGLNAEQGMEETSCGQQGAAGELVLAVLQVWVGTELQRVKQLSQMCLYDNSTQNISSSNLQFLVEFHQKLGPSPSS
ncbi:hypothetical protein XENTR_v10009532 [Xenopus tropicalis]|nr:hypothetical protein XENTR_v10009532 [Xenopus tropicalis]